MISLCLNLQNLKKLFKDLLSSSRRSIKVIKFAKYKFKEKKRMKKTNAPRKTGPEMKIYKAAENNEARKKIKYDSEMYHQGQGRTTI